MGIGGISIWQLLIILAIVVMLFGTKRLRTLGSDLGAAIKGFKNSMVLSFSCLSPNPIIRCRSAQRIDAEQALYRIRRGMCSVLILPFYNDKGPATYVFPHTPESWAQQLAVDPGRCLFRFQRYL